MITKVATRDARSSIGSGHGSDAIHKDPINGTQTTTAALCLLLTLTVSATAEQQVVYPPSVMPRVDMHTHMDAKTQYAKAVADMDQWGGTVSISLAGLFWVKDNNGNKASPASVRQIPGNDIVYVKEKLNDRILFVPGAFTIPRDGIWWSVDEIKTFKEQGFVGLKLWPHGAILSSKIPRIHEQLDEAGRQGMPLVGYHTGDPGNATGNSAAFPKFEDDTIEVVKAHPQTTFIFAHGLFMLQNDSGMEKLGGHFRQIPQCVCGCRLHAQCATAGELHGEQGQKFLHQLQGSHPIRFGCLCSGRRCEWILE